jgi:hypothetical protein
MSADITIYGLYVGSTIGSIVGYCKGNEDEISNRFINIAIGTTLGGCTGAILVHNKIAITALLLLTVSELLYNYYDNNTNCTAVQTVNTHETKKLSSFNKKYHGGFHNSVYN